MSLELSSVCIVDASGTIVRETRVPSEPEALVGFFDRAWCRPDHCALLQGDD